MRSANTVSVLAALENERLAREEDLKQERLARERETRIIREALHPFYRSESKLREKLVELEDRIEGNYDEQVRWMERLIEVDDAAMNLEKRFDEIDGPRPKRRRTGRAANSGTKKSSANDDTPNPPSGPSSPPRKGPSPVQENVSSRSPPHALAKSSEEIQNRTPPPRTTEPQYPRSSGILDSTKLPSALPTRAVTPFIRQSTPDSPRSSGLLDLAATPTVSKPTVDSATIGHTVLVTSTPLFHSSLAPMLDLDEQDFDLDPRVAEDVRKGKIREYSTERRKQSSDERAEVPDWNGAYQRPSTAYVTEMWKHKTNSVLRHDQPNPNKPHDRNQGQKQHGT
ncbi:hypothetical protein UCRPC4_g03896 [Phaeomoniella chlamydospora]|uniref:Uncharacterized protein n=1 Tax=Phaeomoniella chlamydospora TaxID=158046 RepID=A0A0G2EEV8_PHACM|nr:hypothetical protein UCRPC4_g03896 [Phaeomoniella chlamydospora]